jgi:hypothetical protein
MKVSVIVSFLLLLNIAGTAQNVKIELSKNLSSKNVALIKLYKFNSKNSCNQSKAVSVIFDNQISECFDYVKTIKGGSIKKIMTCLHNKKTYGGEDVACFDVDYGIIAYNAKGVIIGFVNISLFCNKLNATPAIPERDFFNSSELHKVGFSKQGRNQIIKLLSLSDTKPYPSQQ